MPIGRLFESRVASTSICPVSVSAGRTGAGQFSSSIPGEPRLLVCAIRLRTSKLMKSARVPAAGDQPAVEREARPIGIDVHRLRVILLRKTDDVRLIDLNAAEVDDLAHVEVLVIAHQPPQFTLPACGEGQGGGRTLI